MKLPLTFEWIDKQINEFKYLISKFDSNDDSDKRLRNIYQVHINTLETVRNVIELELLTK